MAQSRLVTLTGVAGWARPGWPCTSPPDSSTEVCRRLDGLPLALELVAPKIHSLSARDIVARLERRLQFVRTASQIREQRHRTRHAAVDWSDQLLDEPQRQVFDRLSAFASSFTAAQQVAGCGGDAEEIAEAVTALVDRSMPGAHTEERAVRAGRRRAVRRPSR